MKFFDRVKRKSQRFARDDSASMSVEFIMMAPLMIWAFIATLQFFDAYRAELISTKAAITIADMYSREAGSIDPTYLNGTRDLLKFLTLAEDDPDYRVTVFFWRENRSDYRVSWSRSRGSRSNMKNAELNLVAERLPKLVDQERAILVETWTDYTPRYYSSKIPLVGDTSLKPLEFSTFIVTSPREPQLCWEQSPGATEKC